VIASWRLWPRSPRLLRGERVIVPGPAAQQLPGDLATLFEEAIDVEKVGLAFDDALDGTDGLRAGRADRVGQWLRDETRKRVRGRGEAGHVRETSIGLEDDGLPRLDGLFAEGAPHLVAHTVIRLWRASRPAQERRGRGTAVLAAPSRALGATFCRFYNQSASALASGPPALVAVALQSTSSPSTSRIA